MRVGTVVKLKRSCLNNEAGAVGVCYEEYDIGHKGFSFIFENGNYDGFSYPDETDAFLEKVGFSDDVAGYAFQNVMRLSDDFSRGYFDNALKRSQCR